METSEIQKLKYRRQYLLLPQSIECPFLHNATRVNEKYILYAHVDLLVTEYLKDDVKIILLGDIFDYQSIHKNNYEILEDLFDIDFEELLEKSSKYTGRFVLIYLNKNRLILAHDATATRKIYYSKAHNDFWFGSQPQLLARVLNLTITSNPSKLAFYNSRDFFRLNNSNIGDTTHYDEINQLLPNHYFSVNDFKIIRYWPNKRIEELPFVEVADKCSKMIKGYIESIAARYDIMLPVTAGNDSRALLAATHEIRDKVYYYINKEHRLNENSPDIFIPQKIFKKLNNEFHVIDPYIYVDKDFEKIYFENNEFASVYFLPHIYNYYLNYCEKVNLPGNIASWPYWLDRLRKIHVTARDLTYLNNVSQYDYARINYDKWLSGCYDKCIQYNVRIINLFYWEERLGNWGTQIQLDKDIAQEDINPFNSRLFVSLYLSVKLKYNDIPDFLLHRRVIKNLWPELLDIPINPSAKNKILKTFKILGVLNTFYKLNGYVKYLFFKPKMP
jgi:hypothetical protein